MKFANPLKKTKMIVSVHGHALEFPGKVGDELTFVHVPPTVEPEAIAAGLMPESEMEEAEEVADPTAPADPAARQEAMFKAFGKLVARGDREDFAGNGSPKVEAVSVALGWRADPKEVKTQWPLYQAAGSEAAE